MNAWSQMAAVLYKCRLWATGRKSVIDYELLCFNEQNIVVFYQTLIEGLLLIRQVKAQTFYYSQRKLRLLLSLF